MGIKEWEIVTRLNQDGIKSWLLDVRLNTNIEIEIILTWNKTKFS